MGLRKKFSLKSCVYKPVGRDFLSRDISPALVGKICTGAFPALGDYCIGVLAPGSVERFILVRTAARLDRDRCFWPTREEIGSGARFSLSLFCPMKNRFMQVFMRICGAYGRGGERLRRLTMDAAE